MTTSPASEHSREAGGRQWCRCVLADVAAAVLWEINAGRGREHRAQAAYGRCDVTLIVGGYELLRDGSVSRACSPPPRRTCADCGDGAPVRLAPAALFRLSGECACHAYVSAALVSALGYLRDQCEAIVDPPAAARLHVRRRQHDHLRERRAARGAQTRVDRLASSLIGARLHTADQRALLTDVAREAGSDAPLENEEQLLWRLAVLRGRRNGVDPQDLLDDVGPDLAIVRDACEQGRLVNVGTATHAEYVTWWEAFVDRPLGRRRRTSDLPLVNADWVGFGRGSRDRDEAADDLVDAMWQQVAAGTRASAEDLLDAALDDTVRAGSIDETLVSVYRRDGRRRRAAIDAATDLVADWRRSSPSLTPARSVTVRRRACPSR